MRIQESFAGNDENSVSRLAAALGAVLFGGCERAAPRVAAKQEAWLVSDIAAR